MLTGKETILIPSKHGDNFEAFWCDIQNNHNPEQYKSEWFTNEKARSKSIQQFIDEFNKIGEDPKDRQDIFSKMAEARLDTHENKVNTFAYSQEKHSKCVDRRLDTLEYQIKNSAFNHNKLSKSMFKEFADTEIALGNQQSRNEHQENAIKDLQGLLTQTKRDIQILKIALVSVCVIGLACIGTVVSLINL